MAARSDRASDLVSGVAAFAGFPGSRAAQMGRIERMIMDFMLIYIGRTGNLNAGLR
jgi:hypothetical protein